MNDLVSFGDLKINEVFMCTDQLYPGILRKVDENLFSKKGQEKYPVFYWGTNNFYIKVRRIEQVIFRI